ncbi:hypothetical protein D3C71_838390 [compost metagenome]
MLQARCRVKPDNGSGRPKKSAPITSISPGMVRCIWCISSQWSCHSVWGLATMIEVFVPVASAP